MMESGFQRAAQRLAPHTAGATPGARWPENQEPALQASTLSPDGLWFGKDLSQPEPLPQAAVDRVVELMHNGRLHRYGETGGAGSEVAQLERDYARYVGTRYCVAMNSCGATMFVALKALGVMPGDVVLTSAFTLAPVPGAIAHAGAEPVLVEMASDYTTDLRDLERKAAESGAKVLLLSHMRGHIGDLQAVRRICDAHGVALVEDCAHTMGARWAGRYTGTWGKVGCYSTQTYKHINSGEGGLLVTDDDDVCARAILYSGSYMLYEQHLNRPAPEVFERWRKLTPNFSLRMANHAAAMLRPQLQALPERGATWNRLYGRLAQLLGGLPGARVPQRDAREEFVASSIQFSLDLAPERLQRFLAGCSQRGLHIKWFGHQQPVGFTSNYTHWHYLGRAQQVPATLPLMAGLCDMRIPLSLTDEDCALIGRILHAAMAKA